MAWYTYGNRLFPDYAAPGQFMGIWIMSNLTTLTFQNPPRIPDSAGGSNNGRNIKL